MKLQLPKINNTTLFWAVYIIFLAVLLPQEAWTIGQGQDQTGTQWTVLGVKASPLAWFLAAAFSLSIAIVTHRLNAHWLAMPKWRLPTLADNASDEQKKQHATKARDYRSKVFSYRWLNVYALALIVCMFISAIANLMHVVQFTNPSLKIFASYPWAMAVYQGIFGLALPLVSFVFARVLSTMQETEQEDDPAFVQAKADLKEAKGLIKSLEQTIRDTEQRYSAAIREAEKRLEESEQRYRAVGDVIRWLFGKDEALRDRIRGIRTTFPNLSQNGIAQIVGCSVSTVNDALQGYQIEIPETIEVKQ
jgi:molybdopterin converting factor small subunit